MAIPENIEKLANDVRTKIYGKDVREALASGIEAAGEIAEGARIKSEDTGNFIKNDYVDLETVEPFNKVGYRDNDSLTVEQLFNKNWLRFTSNDINTSDPRGVFQSIPYESFNKLKGNQIELSFVLHANTSCVLKPRLVLWDKNNTFLTEVKLNELEAIKIGRERQFKYKSVAWLPVIDGVHHMDVELDFDSGNIVDVFMSDFYLSTFQHPQRKNNMLANGDMEILDTNPWQKIDYRSQDSLVAEELFNKNWLHFKSGDTNAEYVGIFQQIPKHYAIKIMGNMVKVSFTIHSNTHAIIRPVLRLWSTSDTFLQEFDLEKINVIQFYGRYRQYRYEGSTYIPYREDFGHLDLVIQANGDELQDFFITEANVGIYQAKKNISGNFLANPSLEMFATDPWDKAGYRDRDSLKVEQLFSSNWLHFFSDDTVTSDIRGVFNRIYSDDAWNVAGNDVEFSFTLHPNFSGIIRALVDVWRKSSDGNVVFSRRYELKPIGVLMHKQVEYKDHFFLEYEENIDHINFFIVGERGKILDFFVRDASAKVFKHDQHDSNSRMQLERSAKPIGTKLKKIGIVLMTGPSGAWDDHTVESPSIWFDQTYQRYGMVYTGYHNNGTNGPAGATTAQCGLAWSDDLKHWEKDPRNPIFGPSGVEGAPDQSGTTGHVIWYENGVYYLFYIGLTESAYEAGSKSINIATSTDLINWTRYENNPVITHTGGGWRDKAVWHVSIVKRNNIYYMFFNATGSDDRERIGYATSTDLYNWSVDDEHSPLLQGSGIDNDWDGDWNFDPCVYKLNGIWYMAYGGRSNALVNQDGLAWTTDEEFPLNWRKYSLNPVVKVGNTYDPYASKPYIYITPKNYFHYYTAVSELFGKFQSYICLAVENPNYQYAMLNCSNQGRLVNSSDFIDVDASSQYFDFEEKFNPSVRIIVKAKANSGTLSLKTSISYGQLDISDTTSAIKYSDWLPIYGKNSLAEIKLQAKGDGEIDSIQYEIKWCGD